MTFINLRRFISLVFTLVLASALDAPLNKGGPAYLTTAQLVTEGGTNHRLLRGVDAADGVRALIEGCNGDGGACMCGFDSAGGLMTMDRFYGDWNDEKVYGIRGDWEAGCMTCAQNLVNAGKLSNGWRCVKDTFSTGIWLKGVNK
jgi:hypothetical protein